MIQSSQSFYCIANTYLPTYYNLSPPLKILTPLPQTAFSHSRGGSFYWGEKSQGKQYYVLLCCWLNLGWPWGPTVLASCDSLTGRRRRGKGLGRTCRRRKEKQCTQGWPNAGQDKVGKRERVRENWEVKWRESGQFGTNPFSMHMTRNWMWQPIKYTGH